MNRWLPRDLATMPLSTIEAEIASIAKMRRITETA